MPDSSAIDAALVGKLLGDATLMATMPDGVFWEEANPGAERFVIVSLVDEADAQRFGSRSHEDALYLVKCVALSSSGGDVKTAAARIDALLEGGTLAPVGYTLMTMYRERRERHTEVDALDPSIRWQHRGGQYRVVASL